MKKPEEAYKSSKGKRSEKQNNPIPPSQSKTSRFRGNTSDKKFKKRIGNNQKMLSLARTFAEATNFANECFNYEERVAVKPKNALEIENEQMWERIKELEEIKNRKLKEFKLESAKKEKK